MLQRWAHDLLGRFHNCRIGFQICRIGRKMDAIGTIRAGGNKKNPPGSTARRIAFPVVAGKPINEFAAILKYPCNSDVGRFVQCEGLRRVIPLRK